MLFDDGNGILPALGELLVQTASDDPGFRLAADEEAYTHPPLQLFQGEKPAAV